MRVILLPKECSPASLLAALVSLTLAACAPVAHSSLPPAAIGGFWQGTTRSSCEPLMTAIDPGRCSALNLVTFAVEQNGENIEGIYTCQFGNYICRNMDESGNIVNGETAGHRVTLRVMMPDDGSSCIYSGMLKDHAINGGYICMQGAGLVDRGSWHIEKAQ